nr:centromere protein Q isoform X2 [Peromyscus maniculatus bairdii]
MNFEPHALVVKMPGKANASKRKSQQLKRNSKQRADEEVDFPENEVGNTAKRNKSHAGHLSSKATGQAKSINLKRIKVASNKRKTWQPLPKNTEEYLQSMMESVILEILTKNIKGKEQIQCHLNYLKKRLLQQCGTLKVPPRKLNYLTDVSNLLKTERARERAHEEDLALLQEEIDKIVETTESMTESIQSLKNKIQILTNEVEEEEQKVKQEFHLDSNKVLSLPELSQKSLKAPTLQEEILAVIPNQNALLKDLDVLHNSSPVKDMSAFIQEAYKKLDGS